MCVESEGDPYAEKILALSIAACLLAACDAEDFSFARDDSGGTGSEAAGANSGGDADGSSGASGGGAANDKDADGNGAGTNDPANDKDADANGEPSDDDPANSAADDKDADGNGAGANDPAISATFAVVNTWESGSRYFSQWDGSVKNNSAGGITSWRVSREFPAGAEITDSWNGSYSFAGNVLTVSNVSYNGALGQGASTDFGFIVSSPVKIESAAGVAVTASGQGASGQTVTGGSPNGSGSVPVQTPEPPGPFVSSNNAVKTTTDWLYAKGNKLYDANGQEVWLTGVNWFGYNTGTNTFDGLWAAHADDTLKAVADRGFNLLRIPISAELIRDWSMGIYPAANYNQATNSHFNGKNSLQIFDYIVDTCNVLGLKIMIDIHSAKTDSMGHMTNMWYAGDITEAVYLDALAWMARRYKDDDTIIAYDLKNEPHGKPDESPRAIWNGSTDADNWKYVAEKAARRVLGENPNVLIVVEGIEIYPIDIKANGNYASKNHADYYFNWWGGNLRGVKDFPINLGEYQNKLVYSPHDYGPTVYRQPWFYDGYNYNTLYADVWKDNWMFIYEDKTAPLLIGEWGGYMTEPNITWMTHMRALISTYRLHHTFWCLNANSGDTGGLLEHDFKTWDEQKYAFVKQVLWQHDGKFVGLSHDTPLGSNGLSLNQYIELNKK
uniref:cellulase n=1 Tax=uncultured bacterium contig00034 TaxID=1181523 RepID=A0A806KH79_9BACT|nr:glycoside hydrolase family 5 [uncultured bacterium contig00034]